ncbi:2-dehydropantoate 2-reductase [Enterococcus songbeiensis]|uniref:2-dehydropantoate 2-reductase n=1 Tax=Enterococcus songbeiensis TaxID=2559927 RepID=UPI0010F45E05|nr:2-dehydropantoate 2-reductase [Enterococcus songbeiensis]
MKIVIAGAGAMGSRFAVMLKQAGNEVLLVDGWAEHVQQIKQHGLKANYNGEEIRVDLPIVEQKNIDQAFSADLILVFTKAMQLAEMMQAIQPMIQEKTNVLCLLNGIGHEDTLANYLPREQIFIGNTIWTAGLIGPGEVQLFGEGSVTLQNLAVGQAAAAKELADVLSAAKLNAAYSENIRHAIYQKACVNGTMNGLCTLLDVNMYELGQTTGAKEMVTAIVTEFSNVAAAENIQLDISETVAYVEKCYDPETIGLHYPSMHQDLIKNRRATEIDYINGAIAKKGKKYGIPTPYCNFLTQLIHSKEELLGVK